MFSKGKGLGASIGSSEKKAAEQKESGNAMTESKLPDASGDLPKRKVPASVFAEDLFVSGNVKSTGDIQIEGKVEGDIFAHLLTVGQNALITGEITADDVVINGRVLGKICALKVRLTSSARVEGDIVHNTLAIESGAKFDGSVQRLDNPTAKDRPAPRVLVASLPDNVDRVVFDDDDVKAAIRLDEPNAELSLTKD